MATNLTAIIIQDMASKNGDEPMEGVDMEEDVDLVTEDWAFNVLLLNIARQITPAELKMMKNLTKGSNGLGKAVLEKIKDASDLFEIMRDRTFLDPNNLLHLQAMLWAIQRVDLCLNLADYARNDRKKPLYFFPPKEQPENGYTFLKIHIAGTNTSKQDVRNLRNLVAELLLTPVQHVYFVGYEPSSSIIVTFMVPTDNTQELEALSPEDRSLLKSMNIDYIFIGETEVSIIGEKYKPPVTLSSINEITKFMREKKKLQVELQESLALSSQRHRALKLEGQKRCRLELVNKHQAVTLSCCLFEMIPKQLPVDLMDDGSVLIYFRQTLQKFIERFPKERDEVYVLLEATELITRKVERQKWRGYSTALERYYGALLENLKVKHAIQIDTLHRTTSGKLPPTLVEEPDPWGNLHIQQNVLQMPVVPLLMQAPLQPPQQPPQPPPQQPSAPLNPNQLSPILNTPQTPYFRYRPNVSSATSDQFIFGSGKVPTPAYGLDSGKVHTPAYGLDSQRDNHNIKKPLSTTAGPLSRPNAVSPIRQDDPRHLHVHDNDANGSECVKTFMKDVSLKLNEAQRKCLINQTELTSYRREEAKNHPERMFQMLYEDVQSTSSAAVNPLQFVLDKIASLAELELFCEVNQMCGDVIQKLGTGQQLSSSGSQPPLIPSVV